MLNRTAFRRYPLDGAMLLFQPKTGTHVRIADSSTAALRRVAPRVAMFGITNACDRSCAYCSRDESRASRWTVESAAQTLEGLHDAGTLEVAFGGGEPFLFPGFAQLIQRLHERTSLALHVTTHGGRINETSWQPFVGRFGQVRVSLHDDRHWRRCAQIFAATRQSWGANLLVDQSVLSTLPERLASLAAAGCADVSLLNYVGVPERMLGETGHHRLAEIIKNAPIRCRVSVCFGDRLSTERLMAGFDHDGDCGAGRDFVSITPDRRVQSCSFQSTSLPGANADEILRAWRLSGPQLSAASERSGCARSLPLAPPTQALPAVSVWQAFSGNNSGECVVVSKFGSVEDAQKHLEELWPGIEEALAEEDSGKEDPPLDKRHPPTWAQLFARERVQCAIDPTGWVQSWVPTTLVAVGRSVIASGYAADDIFPELRALAWRRGAFVLPNGVHVHGPMPLIAAVATRDDKDTQGLVDAATQRNWRAYPHGGCLFIVAFKNAHLDAPLTELCRGLQDFAGERALAAELCYFGWKEQDFLAAKSKFHHPSAHKPRLWVSFWEGDEIQAVEKAKAFIRGVDEEVHRVGYKILFDGIRGRKRWAVHALRQGAHVDALEELEVCISVDLRARDVQPRKGRKRKPNHPNIENIRRALVDRGLAPTSFKVERARGYYPTVRVSACTPTPVYFFKPFHDVAEELGYVAYTNIADVDPMAAMLRRLNADLR